MSFLNTKGRTDQTWMSTSDLMAGLMMVFILITVTYAQNVQRQASTVQKQASTIKEIVTQWQDIEHLIYKALEREFASDLERWRAEIDRETLTVRFLAPELLFQQGSESLEPRFKEILADFMPRFITLLEGQFRDDVDEVRIEGHTSSEWHKKTPPDEAFIRNMELSQARTREVLKYSMVLPALESKKLWMTKTVSAHGLSSAKLVLVDGKEDPALSRRVEFTVKTKIREVMNKLLEEKNLRVGKRI